MPRREITYLGFVSNNDSEQPVHQCSLISIFGVRVLEMTCLDFFVIVQAGVGMPWSKTIKTCFLATRSIFLLVCTFD